MLMLIKTKLITNELHKMYLRTYVQRNVIKGKKCDKGYYLHTVHVISQKYFCFFKMYSTQCLFSTKIIIIKIVAFQNFV